MIIIHVKLKDINVHMVRPLGSFTAEIIGSLLSKTFILRIGKLTRKIGHLSTVLETTIGHQTLSNQILKMSGQFHIMVGHDVRT